MAEQRKELTYEAEITKAEWPSRWWEPGAEDMPEMLPKEQWVPDDWEIPFE